MPPPDPPLGGGVFDAIAIWMEDVAIEWVLYLLQTPPPLLIVALFVAHTAHRAKPGLGVMSSCVGVA